MSKVPSKPTTGTDRVAKPGQGFTHEHVEHIAPKPASTSTKADTPKT